MNPCELLVGPLVLMMKPKAFLHLNVLLWSVP